MYYFYKAMLGLAASPLLISSKGLVFVLPHREQVCKAGGFLGPGHLEDLYSPQRESQRQRDPRSVQERCRPTSGALCFQPGWGMDPARKCPSFSFFSLPTS